MQFFLTYPKIFSVCWLQKKEKKVASDHFRQQSHQPRGKSSHAFCVPRLSFNTALQRLAHVSDPLSLHPILPSDHPANQPTSLPSLQLQAAERGLKQIKTKQHLYDFLPLLACPVDRLKTRGSLPAIWRYYGASLI